MYLYRFQPCCHVSKQTVAPTSLSQWVFHVFLWGWKEGSKLYSWEGGFPSELSTVSHANPRGDRAHLPQV